MAHKGQEEESDQDSEEATSSDEDDLATGKLGDKLFSDTKEDTLSHLATGLDKKALKALIERDSPELSGLLDEFTTSLKHLKGLTNLLETLKANKGLEGKKKLS